MGNLANVTELKLKSKKDFKSVDITQLLLILNCL